MSDLPISIEPGITWIHVLSSSGASAGTDGTSDTVTNASDRELLIAARKQADWILVSADTFIAESYKPSRYAPIAVVSSSPAKLEQVTVVAGYEANEEDKKGIFTFESLSHFIKSIDHSLDSKILLESGRTMANSLTRAGYLDRAVISITQPKSDLGGAIIAALCLEFEISPQEFLLSHSTPELAVWAGRVQHVGSTSEWQPN